MAVPTAIYDLAFPARRIAVLTGAGMSAESGVPTFRDAQTGLWEKFDPAALATPEAWNDDPSLVWAWYQWRVELVRRVQPNAGHLALSDWGRATDMQITTQNVDDLHERAGSAVLAHLHGSLFEPRCADCGSAAEVPEPPAAPVERLEPPVCADCSGLVRPGVVWFGEMLPEQPWEAATASLREADLLLVVGTSGVVYPAAGLPSLARRHGVPVVEINPDDTDLSDQADHVWRTTAAVGLPELVSAIQ
ncbi:NAD-dependent deacylase [Rhodococcus sp. HNM0563]|uniref:SIR2 family NAD-dependent protein deacylase n=1 Tax=unclassified Rhodococcus (in: high G+C Gram-positive bacteria) TaxID=192944 RepID=UPI00146AE87C|nr:MULTISPECIES: NAD-dependent deacylase [unclassified Rhodococcus (in: high G+C Gram-positive bacteria)]MCK0092651.1 NAD-dependent deacylase [Rhodococcus sp. F64268]NLU64421.1 NAD-dependent deacylase [Rhodococcus sp. HNM0563]